MTNQPTTRAIGVRIPIALWDRLEEYGQAQHPKEGGFDLTQAMIALLAHALDVPVDEIKKKPAATEDMRALIEQAIAPMQLDQVKLHERIELLEGEAKNCDQLSAEIDQLRHCLSSCATTGYVVAQLEPLRASITALGEQQTLIGTPSAKAKKTGSPKA
jgi:hypothetical protein